MVKELNVKLVKEMAHLLARETMDWDEPIPPFETRYPGVLESCLATPFQRYDKKNLYWGLAKKAAALFYFLIKDHPFQNGNKRIAVTSLLVFLYLNKKWLKVGNTELYNFAVWIAESPPRLKDEVMKAVEAFIKRYLVKK